MYEECIQSSPIPEFLNEVDFINCVSNLIHKKDNPIPSINQKRLEKLSPDTSIINKHTKKQAIFSEQETALDQPGWFLSEHLLWKGAIYNDFMLYEDAIKTLSDAIALDPTKIDAYKERAHAYFELKKINLALEDYKEAINLDLFSKNMTCASLDMSHTEFNTNVIPKGGIDYTTGFCLGVTEGCGTSAIELIPSTLSTCSGMLHGVWCFACSPMEVSKDLINTSYNFVEYIIEHTALECVQVMIPELKDLCSNWNFYSDYERGKKIGYIIGKYGLDVLAPGVAINGINKFRQLKRANTMFTLESCAKSQATRMKIIEASSKYSSTRLIISESAKSGKIVSQNPNVSAHVMQKKHAL